MWEGLARTRRQDQVLHGAAKLVNVIVGIVLLPLWLLGQLVGGRVRDFLIDLARRTPRSPPVPRASGAWTTDARPEGDPAAPPSQRMAEACMGLADISNFVVAQHREGAVIGYRYPGQFKDHIVEGADGERIAASIALQEAARPGLIVVHGIFTSSRFDYVRRSPSAPTTSGASTSRCSTSAAGMTELTRRLPRPAAGRRASTSSPSLAT